MNCYFYGIVESSGVKSFGPIGFEGADGKRGKVETLPSGNIAAVIGPAPEENFEFLNQERLVKALLRHQETLEMIMMKSQFILPCKFGTVLNDIEEVKEILLKNERRFEEWIWKVKGRVEMSVVMTWDAKKILKDIAAEDSEIANLMQSLQTLPFKKQEDGKIALGMRLSTKLRDRSSQYAREVLSVLRKVSQASISHETMNDDMVLNASFLLCLGQEDKFFKAVEDLDQGFEGKFNFRCIGPLPPYSFAMVLIKKFDLDELRLAREVLEIRNDQGLEAVKQVYKEKSRRCHPDIHPELDGQEFRKIHAAYELLLNYHEGGCQTWKLDLLNSSGESSLASSDQDLEAVHQNHAV